MSYSAGVEITQSGRLTPGTNVLSFDPGKTNLCYCLLEYVGAADREFRILRWQNFSLHAKSLKEAIESLVIELSRRSWMSRVDYVCIEAQMVWNKDMKVISHAIQTYFRTRTLGQERRPTVSFIEAKNKFSVCKVPEPTHLKTRRSRNKKVAVLMAEKLLSEQNDATALEFLRGFKKKDDLSDSMVQGLYFLRLVQKQKQASARVKRHLEGGGKHVIDINEGCRVDDESPLPQAYRAEVIDAPEYTDTNAKEDEET